MTISVLDGEACAVVETDWSVKSPPAPTKVLLGYLMTATPLPPSPRSPDVGSAPPPPPVLAVPSVADCWLLPECAAPCPPPPLPPEPPTEFPPCHSFPAPPPPPA